jgi:hypothetical protein
MVLASKVWDDLSVWNADFSQTCPACVKFSLKCVNELEVVVLSALKYEVKIPASEYAKYYFLLRVMLLKSGLGRKDIKTMNPFDVKGAKQLQQISCQYQSSAKPTRMGSIVNNWQNDGTVRLGLSDVRLFSGISNSSSFENGIWNRKCKCNLKVHKLNNFKKLLHFTFLGSIVECFVAVVGASHSLIGQTWFYHMHGMRYNPQDAQIKQ